MALGAKKACLLSFAVFSSHFPATGSNALHSY